MSDDIKELLRPKVNWRKVLRDFARSNVQVGSTVPMPSNRRFVGSDIYLPTPVSDTVPELSVTWTPLVLLECLPYFLAELSVFNDQATQVTRSLLGH